MSCNKKNFTQCFWQATGDLVCENTVVDTQPRSYQEFTTFATPNANYNPNGYLKHAEWYNTHNQPCCNVPCNKQCPGAPLHTASSPPISPPQAYGTHTQHTR